MNPATPRTASRSRRPAERICAAILVGCFAVWASGHLDRSAALGEEPTPQPTPEVKTRPWTDDEAPTHTRVEVIANSGVLDVKDADGKAVSLKFEEEPTPGKLPHADARAIIDRPVDIRAPADGTISLLVFSSKQEGGRRAIGSISVGPSSSVSLDPKAVDADDPIVELKEGTIGVTKTPGSRGAFRLRTPTVTLAVKGTVVWARHDAGTTTAMVVQGVVTASANDPRAKTATVREDEMVTADAAGVSDPRKVDDDTIRSFSSLRNFPTEDSWRVDLPEVVKDKTTRGFAAGLGNTTDIAGYRYVSFRVKSGARRFYFEPTGDWTVWQDPILFVLPDINQWFTAIVQVHPRTAESIDPNARRLGGIRCGPWRAPPAKEIIGSGAPKNVAKETDTIAVEDITFLRDLPKNLKGVILLKPAPAQ